MTDAKLLEFSKAVSRILPDIIRQFLKRHTKNLALGNISLAQLIMLDILKDAGEMRMGDLAECLSVSMAAATGLVDKLVKAGLVIRSSSPKDRRIVNVNITPKGRNIINRTNEARRRTIMEAFGNLSAADRDKYLEILTKIHRYMKGTKE